MKRAAAAMAALAALAGCVSQPDSGPHQRNLNRGWFYDLFRPESSKKAELQAKVDRPATPDIDESYDVSKIRAARQYSEFTEDYELRDWKEGVLLRADAGLLRQMKADSTARVGTLEAKIAGLERAGRPLQNGQVEPVREQLDIEKMKLSAIDQRLASME